MKLTSESLPVLDAMVQKSSFAAGKLVIKEVEEDNNSSLPLYLAWRAHQPGKTLKWFIRQLTEPDTAA